MIFTSFIFTVFIAEVIIAGYIISLLMKFNKTAKECNVFLEEAQPKIKDIAEIGCKISAQLTEISKIYENRVKESALNYLLKYFNGLLVGLLLVAIKNKIKL